MKTINKPAAINERQSKLHAYLWANRGRWVLSREIFRAVDGYESESTAYKEINQDIHALNVHGDHRQKVISNRTMGYKLATKAEYTEWSERIKSEAFRKLAYISAINKDAKLDGQITLPEFGGGTYRFFVEEASA